MVAHAFNLSTREAEAGSPSSRLQSFRTSRATQKNPEKERRNRKKGRRKEEREPQMSGAGTPWYSSRVCIPHIEQLV